MRDVLSKLDQILLEETTLQDLKREPMAKDPVIAKAIKDKEREEADGDIEESGLQYYTGVKKHGKEYMKKAAEAGRKGASQEELGRIKDKYSKSEKNKKAKESFEIGDEFGISFTEDFEIAATIVDLAEDGVVIELDDHALSYLAQQGFTFEEGELVEEKQKGLDGKACWKGYKRMGTKMKGGRRVDNCVKVGEDTDVEESGLQYYTGKKKYGKDGMTALAKAGREGASEEELGRIKDKYKKEDSDVSDKASEKLYNWLMYHGSGYADSREANDEALGNKLLGLAWHLDKGEKSFKEIQDWIFANIKQGDWLRAEYLKNFARNKIDKPLEEAEYQGREVPLGKPMAGDVKKSKVYVKNPKGNVVKVNFGDKKMRIKKSNPARRKSFRARHNCATAKDRTTARYWSCRAW